MLADNIKALSRELEIEFDSMKTADPKVFRLSIEPGLSLVFTEYSGGGVQIWCELCQTPKNNQEEAFTEFSYANLLGLGTRGNVLGLTKDSKFLTLSRDLEEDLPYLPFRDLVEDFANTAIFWHEEAKKYG